MEESVVIPFKEEESTEAVFDFSEEFQERIVALQLRDTLFCKRTAGLVKPEYFETRSNALLFVLAREYFDKYGVAPIDIAIIKEIMAEAIKSKRIRDDDKTTVIDKIKACMMADVSGSEFIVDKVSEFARHQAVELAILSAVETIDKGSFDGIEESLSKALRVGSSRALEGYDYFEMAEARAKHRIDVVEGKIEANGITTGLNELDSLLHQKGWGRKELSIIMAGAKRGKTTAMWEFAKRACFKGYNVLGVTLEVSTEVLCDRLDANISNYAMDELGEHIIEIKDKIEAAQKSAGLWKIHEYPSGTMTANHFKALVEEYKAKGIVFDLVVIDYLDIMAPVHRTQNTIENSKSIWVDMRAIAQEEGFAMLSATQTNRSGYTSSTAKAEDVADDFNKIRTADLVISVNSEEEERARGEARLYFVACRNQKSDLTVRVKQNMEKMQFIEEVLEVY